MKPTTTKERIQVLDALRGFALFGILFANLYSFIGYNTYLPEEIIALPIADRAVLFFIDWFIPFAYLPLFASAILLVQWLYSRVWLSRFRQGPLEYLWRKLTYRPAKSK